MSKVGVVTDTISCIPEELVKELNIKIVPTGLIIDRKHYRDTDLTNSEFWKLFNSTKEHITTTAVKPTDFVDVFSELAQSTSSIICITVSAKLSASNGAAIKAKEMLTNEKPNLQIEITDSTTATGAEGFLAIEAARAARSGKTLEEIVQQVSEMIPRVKFVTGMNTLKYLIRSGRAPKMAAIADIMNMKPIIGMVSGTGLVESLGRVRGKEKAMQKLVELMKEHIDINRPIHVMLHYTDDIAPAEQLKQIVTTQLYCSEVYMTPYTPVMSSQTGPVFAIAFYQ